MLICRHTGNAPDLPPPSNIPQPTFPEDDTEYDKYCIVCTERCSSYVLKPCKHMVLCGQCLNSMIRRARTYSEMQGEQRILNPSFGVFKCPLCSTPIQNVTRINRPVA